MSAYFGQTCPICGKAFPRDKRSDAKTCSPTCRKRYSRMAQEMKDCFRTAENALKRAKTIAKARPDLVDDFNAELESVKDKVTSVESVTRR